MGLAAIGDKTYVLVDEGFEQSREWNLTERIPAVRQTIEHRSGSGSVCPLEWKPTGIFVQLNQ